MYRKITIRLIFNKQIKLHIFDAVNKALYFVLFLNEILKGKIVKI